MSHDEHSGRFDLNVSESAPQFSQPVRQILLMVVVILLTVAGGVLALPRILPVIEANIPLNSVIIAVFVFGVLTCFWQVIQLVVSVNWIEGFTSTGQGQNAPRLLAALAALLRSRSARSNLSATSARSMLDSVATRVDEARDITRYIVNLLIFLGLLGTFFGLATTVPAVVDTIRNLEPREGEAAVDIFGRLMGGLEEQLAGMGTAFASSLLGLAGSLIVGLLELFASHGQNRFYRELEDWLSTITRLGVGSGDGDGSAFDNAAAAVLDQMIEQMQELQRLFEQSDQNRGVIDARLTSLAHSIERMTDKLDEGADKAILERIAEGQERLIAALEARSSDEQPDAESRMRLRSIDVQLLRILEELTAGRQESTQALRDDMRALIQLLKRDSGEEE